MNPDETIETNNDYAPTCWKCGKTRSLFYYDDEQWRTWCIPCLVESWRNAWDQVGRLRGELQRERDRTPRKEADDVA